jgi:hypothetical protein
MKGTKKQKNEKESSPLSPLPKTKTGTKDKGQESRKIID